MYIYPQKLVNLNLCFIYISLQSNINFERAPLKSVGCIGDTKRMTALVDPGKAKQIMKVKLNKKKSNPQPSFIFLNPSLKLSTIESQASYVIQIWVCKSRCIGVNKGYQRLGFPSPWVLHEHQSTNCLI